MIGLVDHFQGKMKSLWQKRYLRSLSEPAIAGVSKCITEAVSVNRSVRKHSTASVNRRNDSIDTNITTSPPPVEDPPKEDLSTTSAGMTRRMIRPSRLCISVLSVASVFLLVTSIFAASHGAVLLQQPNYPFRSLTAREHFARNVGCVHTWL